MNNNVDIIFSDARQDFKAEPTDIYKSENIASVQLGSLNGGPEIGIDFDRFVKGELEFSIDTFKAHVLEQLTILNCDVRRVSVTRDKVDGTINIGVR